MRSLHGIEPVYQGGMCPRAVCGLWYNFRLLHQSQHTPGTCLYAHAMVESRHARISSAQDVQEYIGLIMFGHDVCVSARAVGVLFSTKDAP